MPAVLEVYCLKLSSTYLEAEVLIGELLAENPEYRKIHIEKKQVSGHESQTSPGFYAVPCFVHEGVILHEGIIEKEELKAILDHVLATEKPAYHKTSFAKKRR